ncbi:fimbrial protein [Pseudomonas sp. CR3202]|uniref:fimbrial protein n=1 Tax=Pseudomonas sp. CR3202 TaxID=3351532 RepID=UPI003BF182AE
MISTALNKLILASLTLSASLAWSNAFAVCEPQHSGLEKTITLPATISIKSAKIGSVLASSTYSLWGSSNGYICRNQDVVKVAFDGGLELSDYSKVYKTSMKGVGIKVGLTLGGSTAYYAPYSWTTTSGSLYTAPGSVVVELVRIDTGVASGTLSTNFNVTLSGGGMTYTIKSTGSTKVENDVLFTGCTALDTVVDVQMGQENIERLKTGRVAVRPFNFDVRCNGLKPTTTVPVKVYFAGNSTTDGMLALSGAGKSGVASGIGISLVNDKGVKLPFDKARAIRIEHHRSDEEGEIYRFSGTAKYALTSGEVKPGKADATMTYVIDYN